MARNIAYSRLLPGFPRGQRVIRLGERVETASVVYRDGSGELVSMDRTAYVVYRDRLILARDVWPRTSADDPEVAIYYTTP